MWHNFPYADNRDCHYFPDRPKEGKAMNKALCGKSFNIEFLTPKKDQEKRRGKCERCLEVLDDRK